MSKNQTLIVIRDWQHNLLDFNKYKIEEFNSFIIQK